MKLKSHKGFTLIELLVVVAIIGILASVVLAALGSARGKATSSKIQSQLAQMRSQAELYNVANGHYGPSTSSCSGTNMFGTASTSDGLQALIQAVAKDNGAPSPYSDLSSLYCYTTGGTNSTKWAVAAYLGSTTSGVWCVDSNGTSKKSTASTPVNAIVTTLTPNHGSCL